MCKRCDFTDGHGRPRPPQFKLECSWCDGPYWICDAVNRLIRGKHRAGLCEGCMAIVNSARPGDFGRTTSQGADQERDVDANGWLSNAIRLLEDPVERPEPAWNS